jgi:hypothetical protein
VFLTYHYDQIAVNRMLYRSAFFFTVFVGLLARQCLSDENLKTPYVTLDPATQPSSASAGMPVPRVLMNPSDIPRLQGDASLPRVVSSSEKPGHELIRVSNDAVTFVVGINAEKVARIISLKSGLTGVEFLAAPSAVFYLSGEGRVSSDSYRVVQWRGMQYADYAELIVDFRSDTSTRAPASVRWRTRLYRSHSRIEQWFEADKSDLLIGQELTTKTSLRPVMPANLFGRGFSNGKPNLADRRRFEYTAVSEHLCYDQESRAGLWGFVGEIGGQERIAPGAFAMIQNPSFRTRRSGRSGPFILQAFAGPVEIGFCQLRDFIQYHYSIQKDSPSPFEWNQFWLWQAGPTRVPRTVVTEKRLMDVLPRIVAMGLEEFHLDDGWPQGDGDWQIDRVRFPGGWDALREYTRAHGLGFHLWTNDGRTDSAEFTLDLIGKTGINRLFMDRRVSEDTIAALEKVRVVYPGFSVNAHNSTSRSAYWSWGNIHFLSDFNQIYFGEGQFWAWSNIWPEANVEPKQDPLFPQLAEAERFFSKHDMYAGDLITRAAAYQAHWVWPFNGVIPPHNGWSWFEKRPVEQLRDRLLTYLACKFKYEWGFDPRRLTPEAINLHMDCTAWFKVNRDYLAVYQHVLDPPDGANVDAAGHLVGQSGYVFLFNPSDHEQQVDWKQILWEPELQLHGDSVTLSDWTAMTSFKPLPTQNLAEPSGHLGLGPREIKVLGINLPCEEVLQRVRTERSRLSARPS